AALGLGPDEARQVAPILVDGQADAAGAAEADRADDLPGERRGHPARAVDGGVNTVGQLLPTARPGLRATRRLPTRAGDALAAAAARGQAGGRADEKRCEHDLH